MQLGRIEDRVEKLLEPVRALVDGGLSRLPSGPPMNVSLGEIEGFWHLDGRNLVLSDDLLGPGVHHPGERREPLPPLDRWRRAAGSVLEAASLLTLSARVQQAPGRDWVWVGASIYAADLVAPELGLAGPDVALAIETGSPGANPRGGVAVMWAWAQEGHDPIQRAHYLLDGGIVSTDEWLRLGTWILDAEGAAGKLPVPIAPPPARDIPVTLEPWCWARLTVPAHRRGGQIDVEGQGKVSDAWARAGEAHRALAASTDGCRLVPRAGGPVGTWEVASAEGFGQVMGARGVDFVFHPDGAFDVVLADAFVGPLAGLAVADEMGTSGTARGRWKVAGDHALSFDGVSSQGITLHGRRADKFAMPAQGFGLAEWLTALGEDTWFWQERADRLVMRGKMMGGWVEVRLRRSTAS